MVAMVAIVAVVVIVTIVAMVTVVEKSKWELQIANLFRQGRKARL